MTSPVFHVRPGLPPTLIAAGAVNHLVPVAGHADMVVKLHAAGVPTEWLSVPYQASTDTIWCGAASAAKSRGRSSPTSWKATCLRNDETYRREPVLR